MGLTPGSRAIRGSVPIFLSFRLMKQTRLETTSVGHDSLSGRMSSIELSLSSIKLKLSSIKLK